MTEAEEEEAWEEEDALGDSMVVGGRLGLGGPPPPPCWALALSPIDRERSLCLEAVRAVGELAAAADEGVRAPAEASRNNLPGGAAPGDGPLELSRFFSEVALPTV